jgi:broad specificity phosphatase PhoE
MSKLYFFRHAQASFMADNYDQLSNLGEQQSVELGKYLVAKDFHFDKVFVGPLQRQQQTLKRVGEVYQQHGKTLPETIVVPQLKEHSATEAMHTVFPKLMEENEYVRNLLEAVKINPKLKRRNNLLAFQYFMDEWAAGNIVVPDIESWAIFRQEVKKGLNFILENTGKGETIAAFTSGGTIASITAESLFLKNEKRVSAMNFSLRNTSFSSFLYSKKAFNLLSFNELPHLEKEMVTFV